jgi:hypothetical protein
MSRASYLREQAARAGRFALEAFDPLTKARLKSLEADYLAQAAEWESAGETAPHETGTAE